MTKDDEFEQRRHYRANIPDKHRGAYKRKYDKAMLGHSLRAAVDVYCLDCMNWQAAEVKNCTLVACPLFPYRPYSGSTGSQKYVSARQSDCKRYVRKKTQEVGSLA